MNIQLSDSQEAALNEIFAFMLDPAAKFFVLKGHAGCGKSTLVKYIVSSFDQWNKAIKLLNPKHNEYVPILTATTNKAAEALAYLTHLPTQTIHRQLGIFVNTDYKTNKTTLRGGTKPLPDNSVLFIDEASYVDWDLLRMINQCLRGGKVIFIGDPNQCVPVGMSSPPVFNQKYPFAFLTEVVRQAQGNPIIDVAHIFCDAVNTGHFKDFTLDGTHLLHLNQDEFNSALLDEMGRPNWTYHDSKILVWRNATAIQYNSFVRENVQGNVEFAKGDYAISNTYVRKSEGHSINTDAMVYINGVNPVVHHGVKGNFFNIEGVQYFMPDKPEDKKVLYKRVTQGEFQDLHLAKEIDLEWIDLRAAYACTINKAQGSTYDKVFIDINDLSACRNNNTLARMLYVAFSRARHQVIITGDIT